MTFLKVLLTLFAVVATVAIFVAAFYIDNGFVGIGLGIALIIVGAYTVNMWAED